MFKYVTMNYILHVRDVFREKKSWLGLARLILDQVLNIRICFCVIYDFQEFHQVLGRIMIPSHEKLAQILMSLAQNWVIYSTLFGQKAYGSD